MDDKLFAGLHEGLLVHRLYLMSGIEVLDTSPAHWKVIAMDGECLESCTTRRAGGLMKAPRGGQQTQGMKGPQDPQPTCERASRPSCLL